MRFLTSVFVAAFCWAALTGCESNGHVELIGDLKMAYKCPSGISANRTNADGYSYWVDYYGELEGDPDRCVYDTPDTRRTKTKRFGYYGYIDENRLTDDEMATFRKSMGALMHSDAPSASWVGRANGQQVTNFGALKEARRLM
jgi:hypothetical protein